jgi:hypothetical protein
MSDEILNPAPDHAEAKARLGDVDLSEAARKPTPLQSALEKWDKYFTPEEQAALRAYEAEQGTFE